jgi:hypothetical protein
MLNVFRWVLRGTFLVQLLLGIGLWTGNFDVVKPVHIALGVLFVLTMWTIAVLALRAGGNRILGGVVVAWGALMVLFGLNQEGLVTGGLHWTIQVLHLVVAMAGIGITEALARQTETAAPKPA